MLPGALCTHVFYEDLMAEGALAGVRMIAATLPGQGGSAYPADLSMDNYASMASKLAADLGCDVVVGHSMGANVALEMAGSGEFLARRLYSELCPFPDARAISMAERFGPRVSDCACAYAVARLCSDTDKP